MHEGCWWFPAPSLGPQWGWPRPGWVQNKNIFKNLPVGWHTTIIWGGDTTTASEPWADTRSVILFNKHHIPRINNLSHGTLCHWTFLLGHHSNLHCHPSPEQETIPPVPQLQPSPLKLGSPRMIETAWPSKDSYRISGLVSEHNLQHYKYKFQHRVRKAATR
jgi:hypothetical protein